MYVRCEKRSWKLLGNHVEKGGVLAITPEQLKQNNHLDLSGDLTVLADHPDTAKKKASSRRRGRTARKKEQLKSEE